jgi:hypothetical protein
MPANRRSASSHASRSRLGCAITQVSDGDLSERCDALELQGGRGETVGNGGRSPRPLPGRRNVAAVQVEQRETAQGGELDRGLAALAGCCKRRVEPAQGSLGPSGFVGNGAEVDRHEGANRAQVAGCRERAPPAAVPARVRAQERPVEIRGVERGHERHRICRKSTRRLPRGPARRRSFRATCRRAPACSSQRAGRRRDRPPGRSRPPRRAPCPPRRARRAARGRARRHVVGVEHVRQFVARHPSTAALQDGEQLVRALAGERGAHAGMLDRRASERRQPRSAAGARPGGASVRACHRRTHPPGATAPGTRRPPPARAPSPPGRAG